MTASVIFPTAFFFTLFLLTCSCLGYLGCYVKVHAYISGSKTVQHYQNRIPKSSIRHSSYTLLLSTNLEYLDEVRKCINDAGYKDDWNSAVNYLSTRFPSLGHANVQDILAQAWKWKSWAVVKSPIARKFIKPVPPNVTQIKVAIEWLQQGPLQLTVDHELVKCVREQPAIYLLSPQLNYQQTMLVAPHPYQNPDIFREILVKAPMALGCTYNCVDTGCNSDCGNCWVSFQTAYGKLIQNNG